MSRYSRQKIELSVVWVHIRKVRTWIIVTTATLDTKWKWKSKVTVAATVREELKRDSIRVSSYQV
jgi:hypothetical protein